MDSLNIRKICSGIKNFVFIGEAGSGKSEAAINFAVMLSENAPLPVHFFDMDQTKPLLRARDAQEALQSAGVVFHSAQQLLDAPVVPAAVTESLGNESRLVVMDVGGGELGAHMIGQYSRLINADNTRVYYIVNPYRPWSRDAEHTLETMNIVTGCSAIRSVHLVGNPNLGACTTAQDVIEGSEKLVSMLGVTPDFTCVLDSLIPEAAEKIASPILPMRIFIAYPWRDRL